MKDKLLTHGRTFTGTVTADRMQKTVTVEWDRRKYIPKFERYEKRRTTVKAHNPADINAKVGQKVEIRETRPISKTKNFIVTKILDEDEDQSAGSKASSEKDDGSGKKKKSKKSSSKKSKKKEEDDSK